jgi:N-carbamoyl-L-amino-acid hydrolase
VPGSVKFSIDFRNMTDAEVDEMDAALKRLCADGAKPGCSGAETGLAHPAAPFHPDCKEAVRRAAQNSAILPWILFPGQDMMRFI